VDVVNNLQKVDVVGIASRGGKHTLNSSITNFAPIHLHANIVSVHPHLFK